MWGTVLQIYILFRLMFVTALGFRPPKPVHKVPVPVHVGNRKPYNWILYGLEFANLKRDLHYTTTAPPQCYLKLKIQILKH